MFWTTIYGKYCEGYPGRRFYRGCINFDRLEKEAMEAAKALFGCAFANVQCLSGSIANFAVYGALLRPGDSILGMEMSSGGHLTHGSPHSFVSRLYSVHTYAVDPSTLRLDYEEVRRRALEVRPKLIIAGSSSYPFAIDFAAMRAVADEVGALLFADICHLSGLIATGLHPHCFPHAHVAMCTTHKQLRGYRGALILWNDPNLTDPINRSVFPGLQGGMNPQAVAINAHCLWRCTEEDYRLYMRSVVANAKIMCSHLSEKGVEVIGTDTHMFLVNTGNSFGLTGEKASRLLELSGYITNANLVPFDSSPPSVASGIRIGTLYLTALEPTEEDVLRMAEDIYRVLRDGGREAAKACGARLAQWLQPRMLRYYSTIRRRQYV